MDLGSIKYYLDMDFSQSGSCVETPFDQKLDYSEDAPEMTDVKCREAVGSLIYLTTCIHPDLWLVVSKLSKLSWGTDKQLFQKEYVWSLLENQEATHGSTIHVKPSTRL